MRERGKESRIAKQMSGHKRVRKGEDERMTETDSNVSYHFSSVLNDVLDASKSYYEGKKLELLVDCASKIPNIMVGDSVRLTKAMIAVIKDAVQTVEEGRISLKITSRQEEYGVNLNIVVSNAGKDVEEAKKYVEELHGFLSVRSDVQEGTEVRMVIPQKVEDCKSVVLSLEEHDALRHQKYNNAANTVLNKEMGIRYIGGEEADYREVVCTYYWMGREKQKEIREAFEKEDWSVYEILVHALKSTSLSIGAVRLSELAKEQEEAASNRDMEKLTEGFPNMMEFYHKVLEEIRTSPEFAIQEKKREGLWEIAESALLEKLEEFGEILKAGHRIQAEEVETELEQYAYRGLVLQEEMYELREAIAGAKFETAGGYLEELKRKVKRM